MINLSMLSGLSKEAEGGLKESFLAARVFRLATSSFLGKKIEESRKKSSSEKFILEGEFAQKMAWNMGYERAMREVMNLLEGEPEK